MIGKLESDRIDEALEHFDGHWSPESRREIRGLLQRFNLSNDVEAISELIRVDIERSYSEGLPIELDSYLKEFRVLVEEPQRVAEIAFEDYRSRKVYGLALAASRYRGLPGIEIQPWYRELERSLGQANGVTWDQLLGSAGPADDPDQEDNHNDKHAPIDLAIAKELRSHGFRIVKRIGCGAFSRVYLATQHDLADRFVVLKVVKQVLAEPQKLALLQHTNIVPIYSFHPLGDRSAICMPYGGSVTMAEFLAGRGRQPNSRGGESLIATVHEQISHTVVGPRAPGLTQDRPRGGGRRGFGLDPVGTGGAPERITAETPAAEEAAVLSLLDRLRQMNGPRLAVWIFARLAAGLAHSHARGILHGDLKPANVLIRNDGEPALLDFNLSSHLDRRGERRAGGTLPYMAPEVYRELIGATDESCPASDLYSLGVMLFEYVTGRMPYPAPRSPAPVDLDLAIEQRRAALAWRQEDAVPPGLRAIVGRCLAFEVTDRYRSADQLRDDLEREGESRSLRHADEPRRNRVVKWLRRHPRLASAGPVAALLLALLIPTGLAAVGWRERSIAIAAVTRLEELRERSDDALAKLIVDPMRGDEASVSAALHPLRNQGLLDPAGVRGFVSAAGLGESEKSDARNLLFRHLGHVAWVEANRVAATARQPSVPDATLSRLDRLIAAVRSIEPAETSRPVAELLARRARLAGDADAERRFATLAAGIPARDDTEKYLEAVRLQSDGRYVEARDLLALLADRETIPSAIRWTMLGRVQAVQQDFESAKLSYTQSIERAPKASRLWHLRAHCHSNLRDYERAYADYSTALRLDPAFASAWWGRAQTLIRMGRPEEALEDLNRGLTHRPDDPVLLIVRGQLNERLGRHTASRADFERSIRQTGLTPRQRYGRGIVRVERDPEGGLADLQASLEGQRNAARIHYRIAKVLTRLGRLEEAITSLAEVESLSPENEKATIDRAVLLARLGRSAEAIEAYERAIDPPTSAATLYQAACVNALLDNPRRHSAALTQLAKAIRGGYGMTTLSTDPDLESLRELPGFRAIERTVRLAASGRPQLPSIEIDPADDESVESPFPD